MTWKRIPGSIFTFKFFLLGFGIYFLQWDIQKTVQKVRKRVPELIQLRGYPVEEHFLRTSDGYVLGLHRIPYGVGREKGGQPVLIGHGSVMSSASFVMGLRDESLAYVLADQGYDVWMINDRGNKYSRNSTAHKKPSAFSSEFWDFGFDEFATIDYPETIDYVLSITDRERLLFVGLSQGSSQCLAMLSERPEYNDKILASNIYNKFYYQAHKFVKYRNCFVSDVLLAPATFVTNSTALGFRISSFGLLYAQFFESVLGIYEFSIPEDFLIWASVKLCSKESFFREYCSYMGDVIYGPSNLKFSMLPSYAENIFQGSSFRPFCHYVQFHRTGEFRKYDFGDPDENLRRYGSTVPPLYDLSRIKVPTAIYSGEIDEIVLPHNAHILRRRLSGTTTNLTILPGFSHTDFVFSTQSKDRLFPPVLEYLKLFTE